MLLSEMVEDFKTKDPEYKECEMLLKTSIDAGVFGARASYYVDDIGDDLCRIVIKYDGSEYFTSYMERRLLWVSVVGTLSGLAGLDKNTITELFVSGTLLGESQAEIIIEQINAYYVKLVEKLYEEKK